jgi:hypothetical protein
MPDTRYLWFLATRIPGTFSGASLHRHALEAMHSGDFAIAERMFEAAARRYRVDLAVEPLARLRAHQLIARVRSRENSASVPELVIEVERLLTRLDWIESLAPPFELVEAHSLLATWLDADDDASASHRVSMAGRAA